MKSIENKATDINISDESAGSHKATYSELAKIALSIPVKGFTDDDIFNRCKIREVLNTANGTIDLEDGYFLYFKKLIERIGKTPDYVWPICHTDVLTFKADILNVK